MAKTLTRTVDQMGRVVIPSEFRKALDLNTDDVVEITVTGNKQILIKKQENDHE
jgi:AbrB family looped-hinge helix DNA binding protein